jgi:hypothetical protein
MPPPEPIIAIQALFAALFLVIAAGEIDPSVS